MKFQIEGKELVTIDYELCESFDQDYSVLSLTLPYGVSGVVDMLTEDGKLLGKFVILESESLAVNAVKCVCIPKLIDDLSNKVLKPLKKELTTVQMLGYYNIPYLCREDTPKQYWEFPQMKFSEFLKQVRFLINAGNASVWTIDFSGAFRFIDLEKTLNLQEEAEVAGDFIGFVQDYGRQYRVPLKVKMNLQKVSEDKIEDIVFDKGLSEVTYTRLVTNEKLAYQQKLKIQNMQGSSAFTSLSLKVPTSSTEMYSLGACVKYCGSKYVITKVVMHRKAGEIVLSNKTWS